MSLADVTFINMCRDVIENGTSTEGEKVRPREFDSCIIKIVRAGRIKPVLFLSSFSLYYLVIFSDM